MTTTYTVSSVGDGHNPFGAIDPFREGGDYALTLLIMKETNYTQPKKLNSLLSARAFTIEKSKYVPGSYEHYLDLTSKLIKRSYIATHKLVQGWPLPKIIERYELCTKHAGTMPGDVKWWWLRKKEKKK